MEENRAEEDCGDGTELTMQDIVVRDDIRNEEETRNKNYCADSRDMVTDDKLDDYNASEFTTQDIVLRGDLQKK